MPRPRQKWLQRLRDSPDMKILYLHGFASSGNNGSVKLLRSLLPDVEIISPDIPVEPAEALPFLQDLCAKEDPDLVIGTSMGGMYAEQLTGRYRILVNPAFQLAESLLKNNGLGRQEFHNPRLDGQTSFLVTKGLLEAFRECSSKCFSKIEDDKVYGLFGIHDTIVHTWDIFCSHYTNAIRFDGEHYMNDSTILHSVLPLIRKIRDILEGRRRPVMYIGLETLEGVNSSVKAFRQLASVYDVYVVAGPRYNDPGTWGDPVRWSESNLGVDAWDKVIATRNRGLLLGDYFIARDPEDGGLEDFMGTVIEFGSEQFHIWEDVLTFFERLGGQ